jgi:hypothetical protein
VPHAITFSFSIIIFILLVSGRLAPRKEGLTKLNDNDDDDDDDYDDDDYDNNNLS